MHRYRVIIQGCMLESYIGSDLDCASRLYEALCSLHTERKDENTNIFLQEAKDEYTWQTIEQRILIEKIKEGQ